eukprot:7499353-Alexandrium_andersonii.AAC.1
MCHTVRRDDVMNFTPPLGCEMCGGEVTGYYARSSDDNGDDSDQLGPPDSQSDEVDGNAVPLEAGQLGPPSA